METTKRAFVKLRCLVVAVAAVAASLALAATAWAATSSAQGYVTTDLMETSLSSSSGLYSITVNGQTDARLYLDLTSTSGTEAYVASTDVFQAPSGCGYCWDSGGCSVPNICPDAWGYCACYSDPVGCGVTYDLMSEDSTDDSCVVGQVSNDKATVSVVGSGYDGTDSLRIIPTGNATGSFTVYVRARTAAPSPNDMLGDGSGYGPNAYGRQSVKEIIINIQ